MITLKCQKYLHGKNGGFNLDINTSFEAGKIHAIFGESGSGKTSILKMLAGILRPDCGEIEVNGQYFFDSQKGINLDIWKREIGFVFQDNALFPHLNVLKNITFANKVETQMLEEIIHILELKSLLKHRIDKLSGGQAQRVALARALCFKPKILLLDEPFSGLDIEGKQRLQTKLKNILSYFNLTVFLISHDINDVLFLCDMIHHLKDNKLSSSRSWDFFHNKNTYLMAKILSISQDSINSNSVNLVVLVQNLTLNIYLDNMPKGLKIGDFIRLENGFSLKFDSRIKKVE